tara:strand:+ start:709 stop:1005 length:297 start_codon:yes stop_codon:yes gene_type:complete
MTYQQKQWAVTALTATAEQPAPTDQQIKEFKRLKLHWMRKYPQEELKFFSDISGIPVEVLVKQAVDEWIKAHANEYIARHKTEQIALHEQALADLKKS